MSARGLPDTLALPADLDHAFEVRRGFLPKVVYGLISFARRKPLGAFGGLLVAVLVLASVLGPGINVFGVVQLPRLTPYHHDEYKIGQNILEGPSWSHIMGTDQLGRDVFSRLVYGLAVSMGIGWSVFFIATVMSTTLTLFTAYHVRTLDLIMMRVVEVIGFLPDLVLIITLFSIFGANPLTLILTVGVLQGFNTSRVLRSVIIGIRGLAYIEAARSLGASSNRIILRHVLPNVMYIIIISATGGLALAVLIESALAILGIGIDPTIPTIGNMLNASRDHFRAGPHMAVFPGLVLFMLLLGTRLLGDALRDVLDPRLRGEGR